MVMRRVKSDKEDTRCQNKLDFSSAKNRMLHQPEEARNKTNSRNENDETMTTTLDSARAVVRSILDQIAIHDCPPINERVDPSYSKYKRVTNRSTGPRQQHRTSSMTISGSSSNGSATTSESSTVIAENSEAATQWNAQYQRRRKQVEMKMGHVALATLCQQTLDYTATSPGEGNQENQPPLNSRLKPSLKIDTAVLHDSKYVEDDRNPNSVSEQSVLSPLVGLSLESNRPSFGDPPALRFTAEAMIDNINNLPTPVTIRGYDDLRLLNYDDASLSLGHRSHRDPPIMESRDPSPTFQRMPVHPIFLDVPNVGSLSSEDNAIDQPPEYPDLSNAEEIKESETLYDTFQGTVHNQRLMEIYCGPRLQMFGSEYARFLSETPLAPKHRKNILYKLSKPSRQVNELGLSWKMQREELQDMSPDNTDNDILTGAITDLAITRGSSLPPKGFHRLSHALFGENFGSREIHINVKKEPNWDRAAQRPCVTALTVIFPDRKEVVPPGFCVVSFCEGANSSRISKWNALNPADLNLGQGKERVYLCYRRSREGNPLTGLIPLVPNNLDPIPEGYTVLERSPRNHVADLNGGGSYSIFLAYRQRLASLEPLRPLPMILSIYREAINNTTLPMIDTPCERGQGFSAIFQQAKLRAYYCTGGTTVQSNVGKYHIMDRSTHSLLSPTSISNRLALIQASRQKNNNVDSVSDDHKSIYLSENQLIQNATIVSHSTYELDDDESVGDSSSKVEKLSVGAMPHGSNRSEERKVPFLSLFSNNDSTFQYCLNATSAIPVIETPLLPQIDDEISLECRMAIITPILTACYTQHGRAAMIAVQGLDSLLKDTSFFRADVVSVPYGEGSEGRLTILDLAMQSVCDLATSTAREAFFMHCVEFVKEAVTFSQAHLNGRTIGCVFRFYLFVFYFGASVPTSSTAPNTVWPSFATSGSSSRSSVAQADVPFLLEGNLDYFPGGAPQAAAIALKEFISLLMNRLVAISYSESQTSTRERNSVQSDCSSHSLVDGIVDSLVDDAVRHVDVANATQLALHQIHRSGGSELFWYDMMTSCGGALFGGIHNLGNEGKSVFIILFSLLANIVKICSGRMRVIPSSGTLIPRDVASKLLSLELLKHYMVSFREIIFKTSKLHAIRGQKEGRKTLNYCIRRLVVPCLLSNTIQGLQDSRVFRRLIHIISEMWRSPVFRQYLKFELAVLIEQFVLNLLCLGPQLLSPEQMNLLDQVNSEIIQPLGPMLQILSEPLYKQQVDLLFEINRWFQGDAKSLLEFFLNFNTDISDPNQTPSQWMPGGQRKLCERLCKAVCLIAEQSGNVIANQIKDSRATNQGPSTPSSSSTNDDQEFNKEFERDNDKEKKEGSEKSMANARQGARQLQEAAIAAASQIARCIALAAAKSVGHNEVAVVGKKHPEKDEIWFHADVQTPNSSASHLRASSTGDNSILAYWRTAIASDRKKGFESRRRSHHSHSSASEDVSTLEDASACELSSNATESTASETLKSAFHIVETKSLKKGIEFLIQKHFLSPSPRDVATFLRIHHARLNSRCLGDYFGEIGVDDSEIEYLNLIRFNYVRAISFVGMTVEQGLRHFLTNCGFRLPGEAQQIDRIMTTFSQCYWEDNAGDYYRCPFQDQDTVFLLSFAIIMLNTDLHKQPVATKSRSGRNRNRMTKAEFLNNLRDVAKDDTLNQKHLSAIYDSVEANPIELLPDDSSGLHQIDSSSNTSRFENVLPQDNLGKSLEDMLKNVRKSEELLRGLSIHEHRYYTIEDYAEFMSCSPLEGLSDLSQSAFVCTFQYFDRLIKASIKIAHLDPIAVTLCLPLLRHCLCATICLDMMREFRLFSFYLAVIKNLAENKPTNMTTTGMTFFQTEEWFNDLRAALEDHDKVATLKQIDCFVEELEERLRVDTAVRKQMTRVVRRIREGQFLLTDPTRTFVQEGHLLKKSHRVGRSSTHYHFFLFSDLLIYAKPCSAAPGEELFFVIHEVLSLPTMKIVDWYPRAKKNTDRSFTIHHPRKSFTVVCDSVDERKKWVDAIRKCIRDSYIRMNSTFQEERVEVMSQLSTQPTSSSETTKVSCLRG